MRRLFPRGRGSSSRDNDSIASSHFCFGHLANNSLHVKGLCPRSVLCVVSISFCSLSLAELSLIDVGVALLADGLFPLFPTRFSSYFWLLLASSPHLHLGAFLDLNAGAESSGSTPDSAKILIFYGRSGTALYTFC